MRDWYLTSRRIIQSLVKVRLFWKASGGTVKKFLKLTQVLFQLLLLSSSVTLSECTSTEIFETF